MTKPKVLDAFDRNAVRLSFEGTESMTKQCFRDQCDANSIMARWQKTGQIDHLNMTPPAYGDFETADDYLAATVKVQRAEEEFAALSSKVRDRMGNSPATFMEFMHDPENEKEAIALGLISQPAAIPSPPEAPVEPKEAPPEPPAGALTPSPVAGGE